MKRDQLEVERGRPLPLGATVQRDGINFSIVSRHATSVTLVVYALEEADPILEFLIDPRLGRTGEVWHCFVKGLSPGVHYAYRMDCVLNPDGRIHRFDPAWVLIDPYARAVARRPAQAVPVESARIQRRGLIPNSVFDWGADHCLPLNPADAVIYELHVRGLTRHPSSGVARPGTFAGLVEKIPYLQELGINVVELMPVWEFEETDTDRFDPVTGKSLPNFWGYHPISFFSPHASYTWASGDDARVREFKEMVQSLHAAGIAVILDVVFNHTAEGDHRGATHSFRGIDNAVYYMLDPETGQYLNYSGCGNTLNCNHPRVRNLIIDVLHYWVTEMHVDGFRFDLASVLGRGTDGTVLANPPIVESIAENPILRNTTLIAEAWDAAGLYQVGSFSSGGRWAEWNGRFRDDVRRFVKSDPGMVGALAARLLGSPDLYQPTGRRPYHSVNFITCHDGFTLADLVSYNEKHNHSNGEGNADGSNDNLSWNCGEEGPSESPEVIRLRRRQIKNFATILLISAGTPMILAGDELGRTQQGNNNAYCQDNEISWIDWRLRDQNADLFRFFQLMIRFRRAHDILRRGHFYDGNPETPRVDWHGIELRKPGWSWESRCLAAHIYGESDGVVDDIYFIANAHWEAHEFRLPALLGRCWHRVVDTTRESPEDIIEAGAEPYLEDQKGYLAGPRSVVVLVGAFDGKRPPGSRRAM